MKRFYVTVFATSKIAGSSDHKYTIDAINEEQAIEKAQDWFHRHFRRNVEKIEATEISMEYV